MDRDVRRVEGVEQLAALADPTREAILRRLMAAPATITQIAEATGSYAALVRHHLKRLEAVGLVVLDREVQVRNFTEKYYRATAAAFEAHILLVADTGAKGPLTVLGSHDLALEALADRVNLTVGERAVIPVAIGSLDGLIAMRQGLADVVGCHLFDADADDFNVPYVRHLLPDRHVTVVTLAHREQGLIVAPGNPLGLRDVEDLAGEGVRFVNRNPGSGTRVWLDDRLRRVGIPPEAIAGFDTTVSTHSEVAGAVRGGSADVGLGIRAAAEQAGLGFSPLFRERFDLVIDTTRSTETVERLIDELTSPAFGVNVRRFGGYDTSETGHEVRAL